MESIIVPSISKRNPSNVSSCGGRLYSGVDPIVSFEYGIWMNEVVAAESDRMNLRLFLVFVLSRKCNGLYDSKVYVFFAVLFNLYNMKKFAVALM